MKLIANHFTVKWVLVASLLLANATFAKVENENSACATFPMVASWEVEEKTLGVKKSTVTLWRTENQAAIHFSSSNITELWEKQKSGRLRLVKYFEKDKRGIEYMPNEIKGSQNWQDKWQMLSSEYIATLEKKSEKSDSCTSTEKYVSASKAQKVRLIWMPQQKIAKEFRLTTKNGKSKWKLIKAEINSAQVQEKIDELSAYQTIDYTDIGDNESDPFLAKMINMGFVEQGGSGFYNVNGEDIGEHHHH